MRLQGSTPGRTRLYALCTHLALGSSLWGYNIGVLSSVLAHPGWRHAMSDPDSAQRGAITAVYYLGTLLSYLLLSHPLADWLGRRWAVLVGTGVLAVGSVVMGAAGGVGAMAVGRWVCGLGVGVVSTTVPLYQSEISPAKERGKFVTLNHVGFIAGLAIGLWVGYGMSWWTGTKGDFYGWRISILIQLIPALIFASGVPFIPETPRWLVEKGHTDRARKVLTLLRQTPSLEQTSSIVTHELHAITTSIDSQPHRRFIPLTLSLFRSPPLRSRLWRAFTLQFLAQMCGAAAMKYYLPELLKALGVERRVALMAGAVEMTVKIGMTVVEMWIIDRVGRVGCLIWGSVVMGVAMLINAVLPLAYPDNTSRAADTVCIVFIFIYAIGYSLGLGPAAWVYSSEIFPTAVRARGLNFAASGGAIGSLLVSHIWPVGLAKWGSGIYFFFMVVNFICAPIVWRYYPETSGRELEDMDVLFGKTEERDVMLTDSVDEEHDTDLRADHINASAAGNDEEQERLLG